MPVDSPAVAHPLLTLSTTPAGAALLAVPSYAGPDGVAVAEYADQLRRLGAQGEVGEAHLLPAAGPDGADVLVVGLGKQSEVTTSGWRKAGAVTVRRAGKATSIATTVPSDADAAGLAAYAEGVLLAAYRFTRKSEPKPEPLTSVTLVVRRESPRLAAALDRAKVSAAAAVAVRDLANTPSLEKDPAWLAAEATRRAKQAGLGVRVQEPKELARRGFGGILAVGSGSTRPPRLIELSYAPERARKHVVLVGKGITFDSGGLSIKPNEGMAAMKTDMAGGATVIGVLTALPALGLPVRVTGLVPAAENMPSGTAVRPGDVIRHYGGRTVEVLNTDAEGRLVLADALAYATAELAPDYVVDVATLTGAIGIALGKRTAGLFSNDDKLAAALLAAAGTAGEPLWRMPLVEDYRPDLDSPVADLKNIGGRNQGGSITAALFLREFVDGRPWAHLDVASAARSDSEEDEIPKGATGYGVRTLLTWLETL